MKIKVGMSSCGVSAGAGKVYRLLQAAEALKQRNIPVEQTGCLGMCYNEPLVEIADGSQRYVYGPVDEKGVAALVSQHVEQGRPVADLLVFATQGHTRHDSFFAKQKKIVLRRCGVIDPESIDEYLAAEGYKALKQVVSSMTPEDVVNEIKASGLRGRGGGGFPTGLKWGFARGYQSSKKYVICNADEGDPGAFMDRSTLEGDPHSILEGMAICAYAIGADEGYIYIRAEYPMAIRKLRKAIADAEARGLLGAAILGTDFAFHIHIKEGAGAFVCGEETSLIASIEGKRGTPRIRPPFPAESGLWGKPTNINNVETYANISWIILNGAAAFSAMGTSKSKGTKVFAMAGKVKRSGLVEVPMGISINEIVFDILSLIHI